MTCVSLQGHSQGWEVTAEGWVALGDQSRGSPSHPDQGGGKGRILDLQEG